MPGHPSSNRALAGCGGSIDGDDHGSPSRGGIDEGKVSSPPHGQRKRTFVPRRAG
jgi:hypothetical protein